MSDSDSENEKKPPEKVLDSSDSSYDEEDEEGTPIPPKEEDKDKDEPGTLVELQTPRKMARVPKPMPQVAPGQPLPRRKRFIPKYEVEGTFKLVLSEETQMAVEMVIGSHINAQYPWKTVNKKNIMDHLDEKGENSEFWPLKDELKAYEGEEVLMGYIADESKDEDEFYICVTKEAKEHCKQQSDRFLRRQERKLLKAVSKKPGPWTSLGSEVEITELIPIYTRPLMEVEVKAVYPTLYDPEKFDIRDVLGVRDGFIELTPYRQKFNNVYRRRVSTAVQVGLQKDTRHAQTVLRYPQNMWTQSIADSLGSFDPNADLDDFFKKDRDSDDDDYSSGDEITTSHPIDLVGLAAYRAAFKRLRRASYIKLISDFISTNETEMESVIELNSVMDIYSNDYPNLETKKAIDIYDTMTFEDYICFTDVRAKDKYVSCATFHPMWTGIIAICYSDGSPNIMKFVSTRPDPIQRAVYGLNPVMIWSHIDSLRPKLYLECSREVKSLAFCPFNENLLAGGCINGQVVLWDLTNKLENVEKIVVLSETREKYRIAVNSHMGWFKNVHDDAFVPATAMSSLITSHYGAITAISWLSPNFSVTPTGKQLRLDDDQPRSLMLFTGSEDGTIQIWSLSTENIVIEGKKVKKSKRVLVKPAGLMQDLSPFKLLDRNLQPCFRIVLGVAHKPQTMPLQTMGLAPPPVKYIHVPRSEAMRTGRKYFRCEVEEQTEDDMSNTLYCGSQHGEFRRIKFEGFGFNTGELVNSEYCNLMYKCFIHDGIITCTQRNPFIDHVTLTCGGKIFAIWSDKLSGRPLIWKKRSFRLTDARWSTYKPSLLFIATSEGDLETWDLLLRSDQPIAVQTVSGSILTGVSVHTLPCPKNLIGVSDSYGSFKMFINPPIFMIHNPNYIGRMENLINRELNVMLSFLEWQNAWMKNNPEILLEMQRKEGALLAEKEEEKRKKKEEEEQRLEEEEEARRHEKAKILGPVERWEMIIQKLIERAIAVKKRINRAELIENEKPLRELEIQRLEKERRMLEIMKNQKAIFNDTVAILFPEAIQKPPKVRRSYLDANKEKQKLDFIQDYESVKKQAFKTVKNNPYKATFSWKATLAEGKERRQSLSAHDVYMKMHKNRIEDEIKYLLAPLIEVEKKEEVEEEQEPEA